GRLDRIDPDLRDPQLRPAGAGEPAGLSPPPGRGAGGAVPAAGSDQRKSLNDRSLSDLPRDVRHIALDSRGFRERYYRSQDGLNFYYRESGGGGADDDRPPVLCLSGLTRNSRDFHDLALRLAPQRRVLAPDYRGRGKSAWDSDWRNYRPEMYLSDIFD